MSVQQRRKYDPEFKKNAVLLTAEPGRTIREVAENLGISPELIYRWRRQMQDRGELAFPGHGKMALTEEQKKMIMIESDTKSGFCHVLHSQQKPENYLNSFNSD